MEASSQKQHENRPYSGLIRHDPDSEEGGVSRVFLRRQKYSKAVAVGGDVLGERYALEAMQQVGIHLQVVCVVGIGVPGEADPWPGQGRFDAKCFSIGLTRVCSINVLEYICETISFGIGEENGIDRT